MVRVYQEGCLRPDSMPRKVWHSCTAGPCNWTGQKDAQLLVIR